MKLSNRMKADLRSQAKLNARIERNVDKCIEKECNDYRQWCATEIKAGNKPITILAEGDSWYNYSIAGRDVIDNLEKLLKLKINNLASPGDQAHEILAGKQRARLIKQLKRGPTKGKRSEYDILLFSGGGNDLVGKKTFHKWIKEHKPGMKPGDYLNKRTIKAAFAILQVHYEELFEIRNRYSPGTYILLNAYDFAIPNGKGVCFLEPWIEPGLDIRNVPKWINFRREIVKLFLKEFDRLLDKLARSEKRVIVVPTQSTLNKNEWANELHPKNKGFKKIARVFQQEIDGIASTL